MMTARLTRVSTSVMLPGQSCASIARSADFANPITRRRSASAADASVASAMARTSRPRSLSGGSDDRDDRQTVEQVVAEPACLEVPVERPYGRRDDARVDRPRRPAARPSALLRNEASLAWSAAGSDRMPSTQSVPRCAAARRPPGGSPFTARPKISSSSEFPAAPDASTARNGPPAREERS